MKVTVKSETDLSWKVYESHSSKKKQKTIKTLEPEVQEDE